MDRRSCRSCWSLADLSKHQIAKNGLGVVLPPDPPPVGAPSIAITLAAEGSHQLARGMVIGSMIMDAKPGARLDLYWEPPMCNLSPHYRRALPRSGLQPSWDSYSDAS